MFYALVTCKLTPLLIAKLNGFPFPVQPNPNLPYDWQTTDVGQESITVIKRSVSFNSAPVFALWGSDHSGAFRFAYHQLSSNEKVIETHTTFAPARTFRSHVLSCYDKILTSAWSAFIKKWSCSTNKKKRNSCLPIDYAFKGKVERFSEQ